MNVSAFIKKHTDIFAYILAGIATLALALGLIIWCVAGDIPRTLVVHEALLDGAEDARAEYVVGQQFDASGLSLNIGSEDDPEIIPIEDCSVSADFSSAGRRTVTVTYSPDEYTSYTARLGVNVIPVRALEIESYPQYISVGEDDSVTPDEHFGMYAYLAQQPDEELFGAAENTRLGWKVRATSDMCTYSLTGSSSLGNYYSLTYFCGGVSAGFNFYNAAGQSFIVEGTGSVVQFENAQPSAPAQRSSAGGLTLVVTDRSENYRLGEAGKTYGSYVYTAADGGQTIIPFEYELTLTEEKLSSACDGLTETAPAGGDEDGVYTVSYGGGNFTVEKSTFQSAVVGGMIVTDGGYKMVVGSEDRIVGFDYDPVDPADPADPGYDPSAAAQSSALQEGVPSLTLYVTDYSMNPLLGTGNGWSRGVYIYTDKNGNSYRLAFRMEAYVWTYVPLSGNYGDAYGLASCSDFVFNHAAPPDLQYNSYYGGAMYVNVTVFDRGNGFISDRFSNAEGWLKGCMGLGN